MSRDDARTVFVTGGTGALGTAVTKRLPDGEEYAGLA